MYSKIPYRYLKFLVFIIFLFLLLGISTAGSDEKEIGFNQLPLPAHLSALSILSPMPDTIRYDGDTALYYDPIPNTWTGVRFTPLHRFDLQAIYFGILNQFNNTADGCSLYVVADNGMGQPDWPSGKLDSFWVAPPVPDRIWIQVDLSSPIRFSANEDFHIIYGPAPGGPYPGPGWWNLFDHNGTTTQRSYVSHDNRASWITITNADAFIRAGGTYFWNCEQESNDLGECDTLYVETFDCDHGYDGTGGYDSVRVAMYVTHDSNTFWWEDGSMWVQDSLSAFTIPLTFWHEPEGCADSVFLPNWDSWNNDIINPVHPCMNRSMFRHIVDGHTGDTTYNRLLQMVENGRDAWSVIYDIDPNSCDGDSGHMFLSLYPLSPECQRWWEGSRVLLATLTFHVYMSENCDTTEIAIDSIFWPPISQLAFTRYDAVDYSPRHFLPVKDTIYIIPFLCGDANRDGALDLADAVYIINYLFIGAPPPDPLCVGDANCSEEMDLADAVYIVNYLFIGGPEPCSDCCP